MIRKLNNKNIKKVPSDSPISFIPKKWKKYVFDKNNSINRNYYEIIAFTELKRMINAGDINVIGSKKYKNLESYLISKSEWKKIKTSKYNLAVDLSVLKYLQRQNKTLTMKQKIIFQNIDKIEGLKIIDNKFHLTKIEKNTPDEALKLSKKLYNLLPKVKLPELLQEIAEWTNFHNKFIHLSSHKKTGKNEKIILLATIMALGTNIGLKKMADSTNNISFHQMENIAQWRIYEESLKQAQKILVNYHKNNTYISRHWGEGNTSSSDGMRVPIGVSTLHSNFNPHYGNRKGATIYRFVSDNFSSFYTKVIHTNVRDAIHVLDGLLYHDTDLNIEEHYTDTAGYTDQVFALCNLFGFRFAPRIRDIPDIKLFSINNSKNTDITKIIRGTINTNIIKENYDNVLRLAYSIKTGKVTGSLIMSKLGSYSKKNSFALALREMGRIEKTIFILDYIYDINFRRNIHRGLNKSEAINALARALFFWKKGEFRERKLQSQLRRASCLNILINSIIIWNTAYLEKAVKYLKKSEDFDESLLKFISPLGWNHINFLGEYFFKSKEYKSLRPLRT